MKYAKPYTPPNVADCGYCVLDGPDEFGNYDLIENDRCPRHGGGEEDPVPRPIPGSRRVA